MTRSLHRLTGRIIPILAMAVILGGCAAASPGVIRNADPTQTVQAIAAVQSTSQVILPTSTLAPTETATPEPTATATTKPKKHAKAKPTQTPTPEASVRPDPPEDDGSGFSQVFDHGTSGRPEIALTFDAGADRGNAEQILDILDSYGIKASFGITGHWADENPDLVERMVEEGHMVFNHTWSHRSFTGFSTSDWDEGVLVTEDRLKELDDTAAKIADLTDGYVTAPYFRPPYGDLDDSVLTDVASDGYYVTVMWSCDSLGWNGASVDQIIERCGTPAEAGDIILMHVGAESLDADALPGLIDTLQSQGFDLVTVEQLLQP